MKRTWTEDQLRTAVASSKTAKETMEKLGLKYRGNNFATIYSHIDRLRLDTSHWKRNTWRDGFASEMPITEALAKAKEERQELSQNLKTRMIADGLLDNKCARCGLGPSWQGEDLTLQLHHIDGDHFNHAVDNLQLLCPNCHTQTDSYARGKRPVKDKRSPSSRILARKYCKCGQRIYGKSELCRQCYEEGAKHRCKECNNYTDSNNRICRACQAKQPSIRAHKQWDDIAIIESLKRTKSVVATAKELGLNRYGLRQHVEVVLKGKLD